MQRRRVPEQMDDPLLDMQAHRQALQSLNRVNGLFRVHHRMMQVARALAGKNDFSLLDLGAGGGGFLECSAKIGTAAMRIGLDASKNALMTARNWSDGRVEWIAGDARKIPLSDSTVDVVASSLFLHHFDETDVAAILQESLRVSRIGIVMSDLTRSWHSWALTWAGTRALSRSRVFRLDGPRSVRSAWVPRELHAVALQSGLVRSRILRQFPFRMMLLCRKED